MSVSGNPRAEATARLGSGFVGLVLEPSPPAIDDGEWFADDPVSFDSPGDDLVIVSPVGSGVTWANHVAEHPELTGWAADRWLAAYRPLPPIPDRLVEQRVALHRLATYVIAPARHQATGKFGLRWTRDGFGTPFFGNDSQVRVEGSLLVVQGGGETRSTEITTLRAAAEFIGSDLDAETAAEHDSPPMGDPNGHLDVSAEAVNFLGQWWGLGTAALERVRADRESLNPSRVQMWPGHFDPAMEIGDEDRRGSYGASPGDGSNAEPYLYVSAWWPDRLKISPGDPYWNAEGFVGATFPFVELAKVDDQVGAAAEFFRQGRDKLAVA